VVVPILLFLLAGFAVEWFFLADWIDEYYYVMDLSTAVMGLLLLAFFFAFALVFIRRTRIFAVAILLLCLMAIALNHIGSSHALDQLTPPAHLQD
jgi:O-antigen/teichoic acid export membrane protein